MAIPTNNEPIYIEWIKRPLWTLYEAACLLSGIEPPPHDDKKILPSVLTSGMPKQMYADLKSAVMDLHEIPHKVRLSDDPFFMCRVEPRECVAWAHRREYVIPDELQVATSQSFVIPEIREGADDSDSDSSKPISRHRAQEQVILGLLAEKGIDPTCLPMYGSGKAGLKKEIRLIANKNKGDLFQGAVFDKAWERLLNDGRIKYKK